MNGAPTMTGTNFPGMRNRLAAMPELPPDAAAILKPLFLATNPMEKPRLVRGFFMRHLVLTFFLTHTYIHTYIQRKTLIVRKEVITMAGKICPDCGKQTFFKTPTGRECSKCGCVMTVPINQGKGGKGNQCPNCGKYTLFNGKCTSCGAKITHG